MKCFSQTLCRTLPVGEGRSQTAQSPSGKASSAAVSVLRAQTGRPRRELVSCCPPHYRRPFPGHFYGLPGNLHELGHGDVLHPLVSQGESQVPVEEAAYIQLLPQAAECLVHDHALPVLALVADVPGHTKK